MELTLTHTREKMCRDRFRQRGLKKNITKHQVQAMVRRQSERQRLGKDTIFMIHGREISLQRLAPHWRRYIRSIRGSLPDLPPMPEGMTCLTPPPVPVAAPDELNYQHSLLRSLYDYCSGNFDSGVWIAGTDTWCCSTLMSTRTLAISLSGDWSHALRFAREGDYGQACKTVELTVPVLKEMIFYHDPGLVPLLMWYTKQSFWQCNESLYHSATDLFGLAAREAKNFLGVANPLSHIMDYLADPRCNFDGFYRNLWQCLLDSFTHRFGAVFRTVATILSTYYNELLLENTKAAAVAKHVQALSQPNPSLRTAFEKPYDMVRCLHKVQLVLHTHSGGG